MASGQVKWFNNSKGYGFINEDGNDEDLFAHFSQVDMNGYKTLKAKQRVDFDIVQGPKGKHAVKIRASITIDTAKADPAQKPKKQLA